MYQSNFNSSEIASTSAAGKEREKISSGHVTRDGEIETEYIPQRKIAI